MWQARDYIRRYVDDGRLQKLIWLLLISAGIAFFEWSLSPQIAHLWVPQDISSHISDGLYFNILFALAGAWAIVVCVGFFNCGLPALLMLTYANWGFFPIYFIGRIYWACFFHGDCP